MARDWAANARMAEQYNGTNDVDDAARSIAQEYRRRPLPPTSSAALTFLASFLEPAAAIEVGTGTGSATLALLRGMQRSGILTSIDTDAEAQAVARELIVHADLADHRVRMITGRAEDVLARLSRSAYDLVHIDAGPPLQAPAIVPLALERLEPGGVLIIDQALLGGAVADPTVRTPRVRALRTLLADLEQRRDLARLLLPIDDGMLVLRKR